MTGVIETARAVLLGVKDADWHLLSVSIIISIILFVLGIVYFRKTEKFFADII